MINNNYYKLFESIDEGLAIVTFDCAEKEYKKNLCIMETNEAFVNILGENKNEIIGKNLLDFYPEKFQEWSNLFNNVNNTHKINKITSYIPSCDKRLLIKVIYIDEATFGFSLIDITEIYNLACIDHTSNNDILEKKLLDESNKLEETTKKLEVTEQRLMEEDKLANIGQLSAGIAHEINNPLGFVLSNFETLKKYMNKFKSTILSYRELKNSMLDSVNKDALTYNELIKNVENDKSLDFIMEDLNELFHDTEDGLERVRKIVIALRSFSRQDQDGAFEEYDLNSGIETALLIARNEFKYNAEIEKDFWEIPLIQANSGQINQVFLNIIVNASHAIKEKNIDEMGLIKIKTFCDKDYVYCSIEDNGIGISEENLNYVFNPFFTTKSLGVGTGLGLSISYDIIKNKHNGDIKIESKKNEYTIVKIKLPIRQQ